MTLNLKRPAISFDLETTGVNPEVDRIVQLGFIKIYQDGREESATILVNPTVMIPDGAYETHGISDDDVADCKTFDEISTAIFKIFDGCDLIGYNSNSFDIPMLIAEFSRSGILFDISNIEILDVMKLEMKIDSRHLSTVYKKYTGKTLDGAHDASIDARATLDVLYKQIEVYGLESDIHELDVVSQGDSNRVDLAGKLCEIDGLTCWTFGKNKHKDITLDLNYVSWFLTTDAPTETRRIIKEICRM